MAAGANVLIAEEAIFGAREGVAEAMRRIRESVEIVSWLRGGNDWREPMSTMAKAPVKVITDEAVWSDDLGRPMIPGTRIPVYEAFRYLAFVEDGLDAFFESYPHVSQEQIKATFDWLLHHLGWLDPDEVMNMPIEWS